ncbi:SCP1.201-like deaminase [Lentzea albidocapillata subsp. violacea]|uniref:SCP1.201-like deaminase n=1 Tax=Lentzea albidocapillata subsp. violacea TaxID=128104 RepID=A0A1G9RAY0_9PSEU|nr:DddA-like double-stranded DNA deaminase toxin [Lentzea albidocapillata]SDM20017.1 SCP1.201-like deaminase [Lentzea albidocapillata subsp. violacea]
MAMLEEIAQALRNAADKAAAATAPLVAAEELADDAADLIRTAGEGSYGLTAEIERTAGQFAQVKPVVAELLERLDAAQKGIAGIVSALMGAATPAKEPQAGAPASSRTAQPELSWGAQQRATLPTHITSGRYFDDDGHSDLVQSGGEPDGEHERINDYLIENGIIDPKRIETTKHVEMKVAWRMRQGGADRVDLVINNKVCSGVLSCAKLLPWVLGPGQVLRVHDPVRSREFRGRDTR